eukprot:TRINITY_DN3684_c0_g1_i3.p3 TRINITY_DN3684_c0_g1~~TRINITY_DN3684_c0_g1_i3.p3  ORF type:complete len:123 (-),score=3.66 TRINITY_DN3684_c0_g1_i3:1240-1608(-)
MYDKPAAAYLKPPLDWASRSLVLVNIRMHVPAVLECRESMPTRVAVLLAPAQYDLRRPRRHINRVRERLRFQGDGPVLAMRRVALILRPPVVGVHLQSRLRAVQLHAAAAGRVRQRGHGAEH